MAEVQEDEVVNVRALAGGGGGMDDVVADEAGDDRVPELEVTPQGVVEPEEFDEADGEESEGRQPESWTDKLPEDLRGRVDKFSSPEAMARGYADLESQFGTLRQEIGALRSDITAQVATAPTNGAAATEEPPVPGYGDVQGYAREILAKVDAGEVEPGEGMAHVIGLMLNVSDAREKELVKSFQGALNASVKPLEEHRQGTDMARAVTAVKSALGPEMFKQYGAQASELMKTWEAEEPGFASNPAAVRTAFDRVIAEDTLRKGREAEAGILERSGRGAAGRGVSPSKAILDEMDAVVAPRSYGGGGL